MGSDEHYFFVIHEELSAKKINVHLTPLIDQINVDLTPLIVSPYLSLFPHLLEINVHLTPLIGLQS